MGADPFVENGPGNSVAECPSESPIGVAKKWRFDPFQARIPTQISLKLLAYRAFFQADDEGSIPFTRSNT
jgi:hypothetical protein